MFILDTNVIAEIARPRPEPSVLAWVREQESGRLHLTSTVLGEIARGIYRLPKGRRRAGLEAWFEKMLSPWFHGRILPFDADAATIWGRLMGEGERAGRTPPDRDAQIAAVALLHDMQLVTRNVRDFGRLGVRLLNVWDS